MPGDSFQVPAPPDELDEREQQAWRDGAVAMLRLVGSNCMAMAGGIEANGDRGYDLPEDAQDDDELEECPDCGGTLFDAFGGAVCGGCGAHHETD